MNKIQLGRVFPFDTETTGGTNQKNRIIQIAATRVTPSDPDVVKNIKNDQYIYEYCMSNMRSVTIDPQSSICRFATKIHGLKRKDVRGKPLFKDVLPKIIARIPYGSIFVAHNMPHDARLLYLECLRLGDESLDWFNSLEGIDTLAITRELYPKQCNLDTLCKKMGAHIPEKARHSASGDTYGLAVSWLRICSLVASGQLRATKSMSGKMMSKFINPLKLENDLFGDVEEKPKESITQEW